MFVNTNIQSLFYKDIYIDIIFIILSGRNDVNSESFHRASKFFVTFYMVPTHFMDDISPSMKLNLIKNTEALKLFFHVFRAGKLTYLGRRTYPDTSVEPIEACVNLNSLRHVQNVTISDSL